MNLSNISNKIRYSVFSKSKQFFHQLVHSDLTNKVVGTYASQILILGSNMLFSIIVARTLGPEGQGNFALAAAIAALGVQFGNLGLPSSFIYYGAKENKIMNILIGNSLVASVVMGFVTILIATCVLVVFSTANPVTLSLLFLALASIPFGLSNTFFENLLMSLQKVKVYNFIKIICALIPLVLIIGLVYSGQKNVTLFYSTKVISFIAGVIFSLVVLLNHIKGYPTISFKLFKKHLPYGLKAYFTTLFAFLVLRIDIFMIKYILGAEETGQYSIAMGMGSLLMTFPAIVQLIIFAKFSVPQNMMDKFYITCKVAFSVGVVMFFACTGSIVFGKYLICILYGEKFKPAYSPFIFISLGIFVWSIDVIFRKFLNTHPDKGFRIEIVFIWATTVPINIIGNFFLIPRFGITGAGIASAISFCFVAICVLIFVLIEYRKLKLEYL